jgi:hypothetical protein
MDANTSLKTAILPQKNEDKNEGLFRAFYVTDKLLVNFGFFKVCET